MPETKKPLDLSSAPQLLCDELDVPGCIVIVAYPDGSIGFNGCGVNHAKANELLSVGIHINLSHHDAMVRDGAAGEVAQRRAIEIREQGGVA